MKTISISAKIAQNENSQVINLMRINKESKSKTLRKLTVEYLKNHPNVELHHLGDLETFALINFRISEEENEILEELRYNNLDFSKSEILRYLIVKSLKGIGDNYGI